MSTACPYTFWIGPNVLQGLNYLLFSLGLRVIISADTDDLSTLSLTFPLDIFFFFLKSSLAPNKTKDHSFFHLPHPISSYHKLLQCGALIQLNPWNDHCPKSLGGLWYAICLPLSDIRTHVCPWMRRDGRRLNWSMYHKEKISTGWICQGM